MVFLLNCGVSVWLGPVSGQLDLAANDRDFGGGRKTTVFCLPEKNILVEQIWPFLRLAVGSKGLANTLQVLLVSCGWIFFKQVQVNCLLTVQKSVQSSLFRRRLGIRAAFEVLSSLKETPANAQQ